LKYHPRQVRSWEGRADDAWTSSGADRHGGLYPQPGRASWRSGLGGHGNQNTITDASGDTWTTSYNLLGQATSKNDPVSGATTMSYDGNGNLIQSTNALSKTISFTYDALNRETAEYDGLTGCQNADPACTELDSWTYDNSNNVSGVTDPIGQLTTATAYWNGASYTTQATGFNPFGESLGETVTIPSSTEGSILGTSYKFGHTYGTATGLPLTDTYPSAGGLPSETVYHAYATNLDLPTTIGNGITGYDQGVTYDAYGRVNQETIGSGSNLAYLTDTWDPHTGRLTDQLITRAVDTPTDVDEEDYTYDQYGNITSQTSTRLGSAATSETQCNAYDQLNRLTAAWTATDNCATQPTTASSSMVGDNLGAASTYWTTWSYDALGNRTSQDQHAIGGGQDVVTSYNYNGNGNSQPGTLTSTTGGASGSTSYAYDQTGNMTSRNAGQGAQTLDWNDAGQLTAITGGTGGNSDFVYDASGNLLLQKDPGATTLYLPGEQITLNTSAQTTSGVRYLPLPGGGTFYQYGSGTSDGYEFTDQHGTPFLALDNTAQIPTWQQFTPFGAPRGAAVTWIDNRGFLNEPDDTNTGLTSIGARQYDPATGRFISLDPVLEATSPQQLNGYSYAADNPVTNSDPTGLVCGTEASGNANCNDQTVQSTNTVPVTGPPPPVEIGGVIFPANYPHLPQILANYNQIVSLGWTGPVTGPAAQLDQYRALQGACLSGGYGKGPCSTSLQNMLNPTGGGNIAIGVLMSAMALPGALSPGEVNEVLGEGTVGLDNSAAIAEAVEEVDASITATVSGESGPLQTAIDDGRVAANAPANHLNGAMAEEVGWRSALSEGEIGLQGPSKITATGPDYITYDPDSDEINVWDSKYSSSGTFPSSLSSAKLSSWMPQIGSAVSAYDGPYATEIQEAFNNGQISGRIFPYGPG
jgi:RHS repeat-associated protein